MKLLYTYIESFGDLFEDISFKFSNEYTIFYDKTLQTLTIQSNPDYIDGFYGDVISDITAIVGKNGSGKTTLLELIGRTLKDRLELANVVDGSLRDKYFMVFLADDDTFYFEGIGVLEIRNVSGYESLLEGEQAVARSFYFRKDEQGGYRIDESYDNAVRDQIIYIREENIKAGSSSYLTYSKSSKVRFIPRVTSARYSWSDWYRVYLNLYEKKMISSPNVRLIFKTHNEIRAINGRFHIPSIRGEEYPTLSSMLLIIEEGMDDFFSRFMSVLVNYFIHLSGKVCSSEIFVDWNDLIEEYRDKVHFDLHDYQMLFARCISITESHVPISKEVEVGLVSKYIQLASELFDALYKAQARIVPGVDEFQFIVCALKFDENIANVFRSYMELQEFIWYHFQYPDTEEQDLSNGLDERYSGRGFSIVMPFEVEKIKFSTGEKKLLELLTAIIYEVREATENQPISAFNKKKKRRNSHIILVDEIEATMHLEWSRNLLEYVMNNLQTFTLDVFGKEKPYSDLGIHVQLIATTHSPFLLSDLNRNSIIALELVNWKVNKKGRVSAFAQNIQRIMNQEFFIKDSYGSFAQRIIEDIIKSCNDKRSIDAKEKRRIKLILNEVGEPILRKKLQEKFIQKLREDSGIQEEELELMNKFRQVYGQLTREQVIDKLNSMLEE